MSKRKTFKKKSTAHKAAKRRGGSVYKVKSGYRVGHK